MLVAAEGEALDDTALSEDHLLDDDNDDVLNVSAFTVPHAYLSANMEWNMFLFYRPQDDELDEETKKLLDSAHDEDAILKSPADSNASHSPNEPAPPIIDDLHVKKITLKRKLTTSISETDESIVSPVAAKNNRIEAPSATATGAAASGESGSESDEQKIVKLSDLSLEKRLEMRAKKFGAPLGSEVKKQVRAERFGIAKTEAAAAEPKAASNGGTPAASNTSASTIISNTPAANVDLLKKRAERFGVSVSKVMSTIEQKERLQKRQQRFGAAATVSTAAATTEPDAVVPVTAAATATTDSDAASKIDYAEKARLRLERFKTATVN